MLLRTLPVTIGLVLGSASMAPAQIDPYARNLLQLGYDQSLPGKGPQAVYAYYYNNNPEFLRTNIALRLAVAPIYFDGEIWAGRRAQRGRAVSIQLRAT